MNEGILAQIRKQEPLYWNKKLTQEDLENLKNMLEKSIKKDTQLRKEFIKEREDNRKALNKKAKELGKEIPVEVAWHCFLAPYKTYVGSEFLEKYKEWL